MKISRNGLLPQIEMGPRLGGAKRLFQRSGIVMRSITMVSAMTAAYSTTPEIQRVFPTFGHFLLAAVVSLVVWMGFDYTVLYPSEQSFVQGQAHRSERSPLKRDTERILDRLDRDEQLVGDGGQTVVLPECGSCDAGVEITSHKGDNVVACGGCETILYRGLN